MAKSPQNPFVLSGYYGAAWFCNREQELDKMHQHLENGRNVVLYSWRRLGKTALIKRFFDELEQNHNMETIYVDLLATQSMEEAIKAVTTAVHDKYGRSESGISAAMQRLFSSIGVSLRFNSATGIPEIFFGAQHSARPERSLNAIGTFLAGRKKNVVIALDEFQQVSAYKKVQAEALFRNWMQEIPRLRFIYSGSHRKMMSSMFTEKNRPFFQSSQLMAINPIELDEYAAFINRHFNKSGKQIEQEAIKRIYQWCRGQTYSVQRVCNYLYGFHEKVTSDLLDEVFSQIIEQDKPMFASYQKILAPTQWKVLKAVAAEEPLRNPLAKEFIHKHNLGAASSVQSALKALQKKELLIEEDGYYLIHDVILARWLQTL